MKTVTPKLMPYEIAPSSSFATEEHVQEHLEGLLEDEINIGYDVEEDLPDTLEDESWIDGLLTSGFHPIEDDELFGEPITGYSLY